jgi:hypothetical protein
MNGKIIGNCGNNVVLTDKGTAEVLYKGRVITIYEKQGTMKFTGDIWDCWYKISENKNYWINGYYVVTFPIYFKYDLTVNGHSYTIYEIDENNIMRYDEFYTLFQGRQGICEEKTDTDLLPQLLDETYSARLRLSELVNALNKRLNINVDVSNRIDRLDIKNTELLYGLKYSYTNGYLSKIFDIVGAAESGGGGSLFYTALDRKNYYNLDLGPVNFFV